MRPLHQRLPERLALVEGERERNGGRAQQDLDQRVVELLADEAGVVVPPSLYTDSVGPAGSPVDTYRGMMRHNADTIAAALR